MVAAVRDSIAVGRGPDPVPVVVIAVAAAAITTCRSSISGGGGRRCRGGDDEVLFCHIDHSTESDRLRATYTRF